MATIIRSARIETDAVTLDVPPKDNVAIQQTGRKALSAYDEHLQPSSLEPNVEHPKKEPDELKFLRAQLRESEEALQSARLRSERDAEEHKAKAYAEGLELGREDGRRAGFEEFDKKAKALAKVIESISLFERQLLDSAEDKLVETVMEAVCKIVGDFVANESLVLTAVNHALNRVKGGKVGRIRLSRGDYHVISQLSAADLGELDLIEFAPDDSIKVGGCVLESDAGTLDCRLDVQLEQLKKLLLSVRNGTS
jgi:flagellar assembly protein FliH